MKFLHVVLVFHLILLFSANALSSFSYHGNNSLFKILDVQENYIIVGDRNTVRSLSVGNLKEMENSSEKIEWSPTNATINECLDKGKSIEECQNFIRIFSKVNKNETLVCGTNAFNPLCRYYDSVTRQILDEFRGKAIIPHDPKSKSAFIIVDDQILTGTTTDFSEQGAVIYTKTRTGSVQTNNVEQINHHARFISSALDGEFVYFFFRETALESHPKTEVYSRVGRVCKNDQGQKHKKNSWTTFLKTRLNCSLPGNQPFYFDEIQSTSHVVESPNGERLIYGIFSAPGNSMYNASSAVCAFRLSDIEDSFDGPFKALHKDMFQTSVPENEVPKPRPGRCPINASTKTLPEKVTNFINDHPLMDKPVPAFFGGPLTKSSIHQFTSLAVDPQVKTTDGESFDILYIGTEDRKVIRIVNTLPNSTIIEEDFYAMNKPITDLKIVINGENKHLIVVSDDEITSISLPNCSSTLCKESVAPGPASVEAKDGNVYLTVGLIGGCLVLVLLITSLFYWQYKKSTII